MEPVCPVHGRVLDLRSRVRWFETCQSLALHCVLDQDTISYLLIVPSTKEDRINSRHDGKIVTVGHKPKPNWHLLDLLTCRNCELLSLDAL